MLSIRSFYVSAAAGLGTVGLLVLMVFSTQQAFPLFVGNVGTFLVSGDRLEVTGFQLTPGVDDNSGETGGALPSGELSLDTVVVSGMLIEQEFNVQSVVGQVAQPQWKLRLTSPAETTTLNDATIRISGLCGDTFTATGFEADASGANTPTFVDDFAMRAESMVLTNGALQVGYLSTNSLSLDGVSLAIVPGGYDKPDCLP
jgi:hypothetical protein